MNDKERMNIIRSYAKMKDSLDTAINQAGGCPFSFEHLEKMTAAELLTHLCTNNIEFKYKGTKMKYKHDDPEIQNLLKLQAIRTTREIIEMCADVCDKNRGHLQVGDLLRKLLPPETVNIIPDNNKPKSHLSVVK